MVKVPWLFRHPAMETEAKMANNATILIIDDEPGILSSFAWLFEDCGYTVFTASNGQEGLDAFNRTGPDLIFTDLRMPVMDGLDFLRAVKALDAEVPVIVISGNGAIADAIAAIKLGAYDYITKPVINMAELEIVARRALDSVELRRETNVLRQKLLSGDLSYGTAFSSIITCNAAMRRIFSYIEAVAPGNQPVLITGQTGTGKELVAGAVHAASGRSGPFVAVNAAGLDDQSFSDTLFGHVRGAFTGADRIREGMVSQAAGGTLFLDEIGDLPEQSQIKLLRLLQEQEYYPLGSDRARKSSARIVAATNRELKQLSESGRFRQDLFFRLCTHQVHIPALSERPDDLPLLLEQFTAEAAASFGKEAPQIPPELPGYLASHDFPGNVRELKAMVFDAVAQHKGGNQLAKDIFLKAMGPRQTQPAPAVTPAALPFHLSPTDQLPTLKEAEQQLVALAMQRAEGNQGIAARYLGITRQGLNKMLQRSKITP